MAVARHIADMQTIADLSFARGAPAAGAKVRRARGHGAPPPPGAPPSEARGRLVDRVAACMSQDGPFDPEWDMVNSSLISLGVCLDCTRPKADRQGRCRSAADVVARAETAVRARAAPGGN